MSAEKMQNIRQSVSMRNSFRDKLFSVYEVVRVRRLS